MCVQDSNNNPPIKPCTVTSKRPAFSSYFYVQEVKGSSAKKGGGEGQLMKAPYIFSLLSPIVFKTAISFAFMTAAKSEERRGTREEQRIFFATPQCPHFY